DGIGETMRIWAILRLEGGVDPARLSRGIEAAQETHSVMRTILRRRWLRTAREIQDDLRGGVLTVQDLTGLQDADCEGHICQWMNEPMDIRKGFPFRVLLLKMNEAESWLVFAFHHSAADGLRVALFIRHVIDSYNGAVSDDSESCQEIRSSRKGDELLAFANSQRPRVQCYYLKMILSLFYRFVIAALLPPTRVFHDKSGNSKELDFHLKAIGGWELEEIQSRAGSVGVELHDILLSACHRAVEKWNSMHGKPSKRIRIMVPVNVSPKGYRHVVSNQVSWISPSTTPVDRAAPTELLRRVRSDDIRAIKGRMACSLIYFFYFCSRLPLPLMRAGCRFLMITRTYVDSIVFTNAGLIWPKAGSEEPVVTHIGTSKIAFIVGLAPVVSPMGLSFAACIYNKNLAICLTYRPALFSREKARRFLDLYVEEVKNYPLAPDET
ncbi:MAG: hypothetical protein JSW38_08375, partial [Dehalococcoidia bacterium]